MSAPFQLVTLASPAHAALSALTDPGKRNYAARHGYRLHQVVEPGLASTWLRVAALIAAVRSGPEWSFWTGSDVLLTNHALRLDDLVYLGHEQADEECHVIIARDALMIQNDVVLYRNTDRGIGWLEAAYRERDRCEWPYEQGAMDRCLPAFAAGIWIAPQRVLQGYDYAHYAYLGGRYAQGVDVDGNDGQWQRGDFAYHCPGHTLDVKERLLRAKLPEVIA